MDYEELAMESAIWPWIDDDLAGMELEVWDDYNDQIIECGTGGNVGPRCPSSSNNDRDGAGPVARSCISDSFPTKSQNCAKGVDKGCRYSTIRT